MTRNNGEVGSKKLLAVLASSLSTLGEVWVGHAALEDCSHRSLIKPPPAIVQPRESPKGIFLGLNPASEVFAT